MPWSAVMLTVTLQTYILALIQLLDGFIFLSYGLGEKAFTSVLFVFCFVVFL